MKREKNMYTVTYNYYNYASQSKSFDTYVAAKGFFNRINRDRRVRRAAHPGTGFTADFGRNALQTSSLVSM